MPSILRVAARVELGMDRELSSVRGIGFTDYRPLRDPAGRDAAAASGDDGLIELLGQPGGN